MANDQRFQILFEAEQHFFVPDCPLWVSRCRLSLDRETGRRLLQVRLVNRSGRPVGRVFLRVVCFDARRRRLSQLDYVPLPAVPAAAGAVFGDKRAFELAAPAAAEVEVYVQRVRFTDGGVWDEDPRESCLAFAPPVPIPSAEGGFEALRRAARAAGLRSDYYYNSQDGVWTCSCGVPNGTRDPVCCRCGAGRDRLEQLMRRSPAVSGREAFFAPAKAGGSEAGAAFSRRTELQGELPPDRDLPAQPDVPVAPPLPMEQLVAAWQPDAPPGPPAGTLQPQGPQSEGRRGRPQRSRALQANGKGAAPSPERPAPEKNSRRGALIAALLVLVLLGVFAADRWLMPALRYKKAVQAQAAGEFSAARDGFSALGDYKDSKDQIRRTTLLEAAAQMEQGQYEQAFALVENLEGGEQFAADCLYSLSVLALNEADPEKAALWADRLEQRFPEDERLPELRPRCLYAQANRLAAQAAEQSDPAKRIRLYQNAENCFRESGFADSTERGSECRYRIACTRMEEGDYRGAVTDFSAAPGYKDALSKLQACMYGYVLQHLHERDETAETYLSELGRMDYPEARDLVARSKGEGFRFRLYFEGEKTAGKLDQLRIDYTVCDGAVIELYMRKLLPDGMNDEDNLYPFGSSLNPDGRASGTCKWEELFPGELPDGDYEIEFHDTLFLDLYGARDVWLIRCKNGRAELLPRPEDGQANLD